MYSLYNLIMNYDCLLLNKYIQLITGLYASLYLIHFF